MHLPASASLARSADGQVSLRLDPGGGSAPDLDLDLAPCPRPDPLPAPWHACFADYEALLAYDVPQDRALSTQPWLRRTSRQEISLGIPLSACEPLAGEVRSRALRRYAGGAEPLCFRVPHVRFSLDREARDPWRDAPIAAVAGRSPR